MGLCAPYPGMGRKRSQKEIDEFYDSLRRVLEKYPPKQKLPEVNTDVFTNNEVCDTLIVPGRSLNDFDEDLGRLRSE